jgi:hypothetical protein
LFCCAHHIKQLGAVGHLYGIGYADTEKDPAEPHQFNGLLHSLDNLVEMPGSSVTRDEDVYTTIPRPAPLGDPPK